MSREIMQQAFDALNTCDWDYDYDEESYKTFDEDLVNAAAAALEAELAKPESKLTNAGADTNISRGLEPKGSGMVTLNQPEQEPVAWMYKGNFHNFDPSEWASPEFAVTPLYTAPPRKPWVGLTDEERNEMIGRIKHDQYTRQRDLIGLTQIITEMYLKEKNA